VAIIDDIVQAALAEFSEVGIRRTSINDVARRAGLGRATVYRYVGSKDRLIQLVIEAETRRGYAEFDRAVAEHDDAADWLEAGFGFVVQHLRGHPLFDRVLRREPELLLPALTVDGGPVLAFYRSLIARRLRDMKERGRIDPVDEDAAAEALARLAISFVLTPASVVAADDPHAVSAFARQILLPMLRPV
jgi:AcrR family transcriptional regulator